MKNKLVLVCLLLSFTTLRAQQLQPGFDATEYMDMLRVSSQHLDSLHPKYVLPLSDNYKRVYRSPVVGLQNRFDIWTKGNNMGVISIRATIAQNESWIENFYTPMIASEGSIQLDKTHLFQYKVAAESKAYVHLGWMIGLGSMAPDIVHQINLLYNKGIKQFIIIGHSQGGALAFLLRSYLQYLDEKILPKDIIFKTYCSAPPKPGNLYYSYDFDYITRGGWGFRIVNPLDWVPETPFTVQVSSDANTVSPLRNREESMKHLGFASRTYLKMVYRKLNKSTRKSLRMYDNYLGHKLYLLVKRNHPDYKEPTYMQSVNYTIAGTPIILFPNDVYNQAFSDKDDNSFLHHSYNSYLFLTEQNYPTKK